MSGAPYDVAIIGAGSAGSAIASRASENPDLRVLLIEAGQDYPLLAETPLDLVNGHHNSTNDHDWHNRYVPTVHAQPQRFPRGRVTGGSSAVNTAIALRGMPEDYDGWAHEHSRGQARAGMKVAMVAFGSGFTWGAAIVDW